MPWYLSWGWIILTFPIVIGFYLLIARLIYSWWLRRRSAARMVDDTWRSGVWREPVPTVLPPSVTPPTAPNTGRGWTNWLMRMRVPGFRSGTPWKQGLACVCYLPWLLFVIALGASVAQNTFPRGGYVWFLLNSVLFYALVFDICRLRTHLPLRVNAGLKVAVWTLVTFACSTTLAMAIPDSPAYAAYQASQRLHEGAVATPVAQADQATASTQKIADPGGAQEAAAKPPESPTGAVQPNQQNDADMTEDAPAGVTLPAPGAVAPTSDGIPCRSGDVLTGVYHPARLTVVTSCKSVTGQVTTIRHEKDGDYHINILLDAAYADLVNEVNRAQQHGDLVVEVIPADAASVPIPHAGDHVQVVGAYVLDQQHGGWAEIHPAWRITPVDRTAPISGAPAPSVAVPAPPVAKPTPEASGSTTQSSVSTYPANLTSICLDGSWSFSAHAQGTCSHHGGVAQWIHHP